MNTQEDSFDHKEWLAESIRLHEQFQEVLGALDNVVVLPTYGDEWHGTHFGAIVNGQLSDAILRQRNIDFTYLLEGDIDWDWSNSRGIDRVNTVLRANNSRVTVCTSAYNLQTEQDVEYLASNIRLVFVEELHGFYHSSWQPFINEPSKQYCYFARRLSESRLTMFAELLREDMLDVGHVSFRADGPLPINIETDSVAQKIRIFYDHMQGNINGSIISQEAVEQICNIAPYRSFNDPHFLQSIENDARISIVDETYNTESDFKSDVRFCLTEKALRSAIVPNISLYLGPHGHLRLYDRLGIRVHPLNRYMDNLIFNISKANFIIGLLKYGNIQFNQDALYEDAVYNKELIAEWHRMLHSPDYDVRIQQLVLGDWD